jgi:lysozyme
MGLVSMKAIMDKIITPRERVVLACADFISFLESSNGPRLLAYRDIAGVWTIGYGTTGPDIVEGVIWTKEQCDAALDGYVDHVCAYVLSLLGSVSTNTNQIIAMVSLCYNVGNSAFRSSSVLGYHRLGNYRAAANSFLLWDKAHVDGRLVTVPGLFERRKAELARYELTLSS